MVLATLRWLDTCWDWLRPDTVLFCVASEQPEEETFCPAHFEEKHPNLPQWMTGNLSFRSQRRCMLGDLGKCTPVPWLNSGHQSSSTEVCRFCCPCGCTEAWCQWLCAAPPLRTQRSKISAFDKALFESKALGQAGPECCSQKT